MDWKVIPILIILGLIVIVSGCTSIDNFNTDTISVKDLSENIHNMEGQSVTISGSLHVAQSMTGNYKSYAIFDDNYGVSFKLPPGTNPDLLEFNKEYQIKGIIENIDDAFYISANYINCLNCD